MNHAFEIVDVFTRSALAGNQLAVVTDARGLTEGQMQAIAKEFGFAESTFVLPPADPANTAQLRIFTPEEEMPFAGHPNVGTGFVLGRMGSLFGRLLGDRLLLEEVAGLVVVDVERRDGAVSGAWVKAPRALAVGTAVSVAVVAELAGLDPADILTARVTPGFASVGAEFLLAEIPPTALERARPDWRAFERHEGRIGQSGGLMALHLHARRPEAPELFDVRMFAPLSGTVEDAATGSAAAALGALLHSLDPAEGRFTIHQGRHMGRPSVIAVDAGPDGVRIGGDCAAFATGSLTA
jgi:trans-2,3-dihydro-3-hydroxyanthranilate isomerase